MSSPKNLKAKENLQAKILLLILLLLWTTPCQAENNFLALNSTVEEVSPQAAASRVDELSQEILLKEIELEKFNLHYKLENSSSSRWQGWRYAAFQEANLSLNLTNGIITTGERASHFHHPDKLSDHELGVANIDGMIGSWIGATAAVFESVLIELKQAKIRKEGFASNVAKKHVMKLKSQINQLLVERNALIAIENSAPLLAHANVDVAEGKVLEDLRDLTLHEYTQFHIGSAKYLAFQRALYFFDFAKFSTSAIGSYFAYLAVHKHDAKWNARAGVLFDVSGALIMTTPIISRLIGLGAAKLAKHTLTPILKDTKTNDVETLETDRAALEQLSNEHQGNSGSVHESLKRALVYSTEDKGFSTQLESNLRQIEAGRLTATQTVLAGLFTGGTKLASGILFTNVGYNYNGRSEADRRIRNYNLGAAAIVGIPGSSVAILDTLRIQVKGELAHHKLAKQGKLPSQLLKSRLAQLEDVEKQLLSPK